MKTNRPDAICINVRGSVAIVIDPTTGHAERYTYQRVAPGCGNLPGPNGKNYQIRRRPVPVNPKTPAQQNLQLRFAIAVAGWQIMTDAQRQHYRKRAAQMTISGYNLWLKEFAQRNPETSPVEQWIIDAGVYVGGLDGGTSGTTGRLTTEGTGAQYTTAIPADGGGA